tara:strand:- start:958 stop:2283 length:1326 start_codon:yes stop_codon:yes gene_type:complete
MASIDKLKTKSLEDLTLNNTFVYLMNITTNVESRISLTTLIGGAAITTGVGASVYAGLVNNALNFRSLKSDSSIVSITSTKTQVNFNILPQYIDLSLCKNTTSNFLSTVNLTTNVGSTILPVANGGTGASTLTDGGILLGSGTGAVTSMASLAAGSIIQGDGTTDPAVLALGTAGQMLVVNAGATALEYAPSTASFVALATATLDMDNNSIDLGTGWISKDGIGAYGLKFDNLNFAHFVPDTEAATGGTAGVNISGGIFLQGKVNRNITLGAPATGNGSVFTINGSIPGTSSSDGGAINIKPGSSTSGDGGDLNLYAGSSTSGPAGDISLLTRAGSSTTFPILRIANDKKVSIQNSSTNKTPVGLLDIHQTEGGIPVLRLKQDDVDYAFAQFTGSTAAASTTNISTSTATAAAKTGAIKVLVQNGSESASVAWIRLWASAV